MSVSNKEYDSCSSELYSNLDKIRHLISEPALYEQMAEECSELSQALLKKARKLRNENYTPKSYSEINDNLIEEYTDVRLCAMVLSLSIDETILSEKLNRWIFRNSDIGKNLMANGEPYENS